MKVLRQSDHVCVSSATHSFQEALQCGQQPSIEQYLSETGDADRTEVFRELLSVELSRLRRSSAGPRLEVYLERFPEFEAIVREQFIGFDSFQMSMDSTMSHATSCGEAPSGSIHPSDGKPELERYRLLEQLGQGGFGQVWRAFDDESNRYVAIKGPRADRGVTPARVASFLAEAQRVREINVHGVVKVLDVVQTPETPTSASLCFIVMELMDGGSLADRLGAGIGRRQAVRWVASLSETLAELHRHDVVHRDIKPENILFDKRGRLYLSDFGLAATEAEQLAEQPGVLGTVAYMAPEQARGTHVDRRADIYSLGVVLYRMISGNKLPYLANSREEFLRQLLDENIAPRAIPDTVPSRLARVCERCIHKQASQRYRTAAELGRELRFWRNGLRMLYAGAGFAILGVLLALASTAYLLSSHGQPTALAGRLGPDSNQAGDGHEPGTATAVADRRTPCPRGRLLCPLDRSWIRRTMLRPSSIRSSGPMTTFPPGPCWIPGTPCTCRRTTSRCWASANSRRVKISVSTSTSGNLSGPAMQVCFSDTVSIAREKPASS